MDTKSFDHFLFLVLILNRLNDIKNVH